MFLLMEIEKDKENNIYICNVLGAVPPNFYS